MANQYSKESELRCREAIHDIIMEGGRYWSSRRLAEEVKRRLGLKTYDPQTAEKHRKALYEEWSHESARDVATECAIAVKKNERLQERVLDVITMESDPKVILEGIRILKDIQAEGNKLRGVYPAEKREVSGSMGFLSLLIDSGMIDENGEGK